MASKKVIKQSEPDIVVPEIPQDGDTIFNPAIYDRETIKIKEGLKNG